jgi:peptidoglycan/LPS O-acetylase OafA/YrhL
MDTSIDAARRPAQGRLETAWRKVPAWTGLRSDPTPAGTRSTRRVAQLDGLRGIAMLMVLAQHSALPIGRGAIYAIDFFFALSGFLITGVLLGEWNRNGRISPKRFYQRRILRLYPVLLVVLILCTPIGPSISYMKTWGDWFTSVAAAATYTSNLVILERHHLSLGVLDPTWSLAVEEQFYLLWPLLLIGLLTLRLATRWIVAILLTLSAAGLSLFWLLYHPPPLGAPPLTFEGLDAYVRPDARFGEILLGCALAIVLSRRPGPLPTWVNRLLGVASIAAVVAVVLVRQHYVHTLDQVTNQLAPVPLIAICSVVILARLVTSDSAILSRVLRLAPLPQIGLISYSLYIWHMAIFQIVMPNPLGIPGPSEQWIQWTLTLFVGYLSYRFVEKPCLRLSAKLRTTSVAGLEHVKATEPGPATPSTHPSHRRREALGAAPTAPMAAGQETVASTSASP